MSKKGSNPIPVLGLTEENLKKWRKYWFPDTIEGGSAVRMVVALIDAVAKEKGWDLTKES